MLHLLEGEYLGNYVKTTENSLFKFSITHYTPNTFIEEHYHTNPYLSLVIGGSYVENNKKIKQIANCGDLLFRPSGYIHQNLFNAYNGACFNIEFKENEYEILGKELTLPQEFLCHSIGRFPSIYRLFLQFNQAFNEDVALEWIFDWLFELQQKELNISRIPWINQVLKILENELDRFHSLKNLSERVFVHPVYLSRAFKTKTGLTISEYQLQCKLKKTVHLLLTTSKSISQITYANGFYDDAHFIRSFKGVYGISPHQFRIRFKS